MAYANAADHADRSRRKIRPIVRINPASAGTRSRDAAHALPDEAKGVLLGCLLPCLAMKLESILRPGFELREGVYYYTHVREEHVPKDIDPYFGVFDKSRWSPWRTHNFAFLKAEMERMPRGLILADLGAGVSPFRELYERFEVVPIDFHPFELVTVVSDLNTEIPLKDGSTHVLVMSDVLEHIAEPARLLGECRRVLATSGVLLGTVPFLHGIHMRPYDYYRYTDIALTRLLTAAGFKTVEVTPVVANHALFRAAAERFFGDLIEHHRRGTVVQRLLAFALRVYWFFFVLTFFKLGKRLGRFSGASPDEALGYHFRAGVEATAGN